MKTTITLNGKKISKKLAADTLGKDTINRYLKQAAEGFREDPYEQQSWHTKAGMLTIEFGF